MTYNRCILTAISLLAVGSCSWAQTTGSDHKQSFAEYRKSLLNNYQQYRSQVLENYAQFLSGIWDDFNKFKGEERDSVPKPETPPIVFEEIPYDRPAMLPDKEAEPKVKPQVPATKPKPKPKQETVPAQPKPKQETVPAQPKQDKTPTVPVLPKQEPKPVPKPKTTPAEPASSPRFNFDFYGMSIAVPEITVRIKEKLGSPKEYGQQWEKLAKGGIALKIADNLNNKAKEMQLNPYLTYVMVKDWVDASYPSCQATSRMSMTHFLLANMGFDVRISLTGTGEPVLLMPSQQTIYSRPYLMIDNRRYYIFPDNDDNLGSLDFRFSTCRLPKDADLGKVLDLQIHDLKLPYKARPYSIEYGGMKLEGEVNGNLQGVLKKYPHMDMSNYSESIIDRAFRDDVVNQVSQQLDGMDQTAAVNKLLQFIQKGFAYATDHAYHGYEKPYFFEEMMLYDKCDCEDRAIFYTYLLWNALGVKNNMINYPGHESVGVNLDTPVTGTHYENHGETYFISDPTYIGSRTGQCMPSYEKTQPRVDYEYR